RRRAAMAKDLGDLRQRRAGAQHLGRCRVAKAMRRHIRDPGPLAGALQYSADGSGVGQADERGVMPEEHPAAGTLGPTSLQVGSQRRPDVCWKGEAVFTAALAAHKDLAAAPIEVFELEPDNFTAAQAEAGE